jgi:hypothetical protein
LIVMRLVDGQRHVIGDIVRVLGVDATGEYLLESVA